MDKEDVIFTNNGVLLCHNSVTKGGRGRGEKLGVWDQHIHATIYKTDNNKDLLYI